MSEGNAVVEVEALLGNLASARHFSRLDFAGCQGANGHSISLVYDVRKILAVQAFVSADFDYVVLQ